MINKSYKTKKNEIKYSCLDLKTSFCTFDLQKLFWFTKFYPSNFSPVDFMLLEDQLQIKLYRRYKI